jgi:hypothetical protein
LGVEPLLKGLLLYLELKIEFLFFCKLFLAFFVFFFCFCAHLVEEYGPTDSLSSRGSTARALQFKSTMTQEFNLTDVKGKEKTLRRGRGCLNKCKIKDCRYLLQQF